MRYRDLVNEDPSATNDYQQMMAFVNANRAPGVPPDQQIALAMYKELQKQQALSKNLSAELQAAEKRIDQATQSGELAGQELGKHQAELERERDRGDKQKDAVSKIDQEHSAREKASAEQMQQLTSQLETIKSKPGVSAEAGQELEKQIEAGLFKAQAGQANAAANQANAHAAVYNNMVKLGNENREAGVAVKDALAKYEALSDAEKAGEKVKLF